MDWMKERLGKASAVDFVMDTNAVRALADLSDREWSGFRNRTARLRLRSGWIPWVVVELMVTNLSGNNGELPEDEFGKIKLAVSRHHELVGQNILPRADERLFRDVYALAGVRAPRRSVRWLDTWRRGIETFSGLECVQQVAVEKDEKQVVATYYDVAGVSRLRFNAPLTFQRYVRQNTRNFVSPPQTKRQEDVLHAAIERAGRWLTATCQRIGLPEEVVRTALERGTDESLLDVAIIGVIEGVYLSQHVSGIRSRVDENDGRDIEIGSYLTESTVLVTNDARLAALLRGVFVRDKIISFTEFLAATDDSSG